MVDQKAAPEARHGADEFDLLDDRPVFGDFDVEQSLHYILGHFDHLSRPSPRVRSVSFTEVNNGVAGTKRAQPEGWLLSIERMIFASTD